MKALGGYLNMKNFVESYKLTCRMVIREIDTALASVDIEAAERLVDDILKAEDVFLIGVGRVMMSLQAFCKRLTHLGINAHCVGDITEPAIKETDLLIVASGSGESVVPIVIAKKAKEFNAKVVHIGSNVHGSIEKYSDYIVRIPTRTRLYLKDEIDSQQIMTSLFEQVLLIFGDVIAKIIVNDRDVKLDELWHYHANLE